MCRRSMVIVDTELVKARSVTLVEKISPNHSGNNEISFFLSVCTILVFVWKGK